MRFYRFTYALSWAIGLTIVLAGHASLDLIVERRNALLADPLLGVRRALIAATVGKRDLLLSNSSSLDKSFDGAVLFALYASPKRYWSRWYTGGRV
jgi:hypothetical protein